MNGFINQFPYSDAHELNLDWIIKTVKDLSSDMESFKAINSIKYLGDWSITEQYQPWSIVFNDGYDYMSLKIVPAGIDIINSDYWLQIPLITIDNALDSDSLNPVSNKRLTMKFNSIDEANTQIRALISGLRTDLTSLGSDLNSTDADLRQEIVNRASSDELLNQRINSIEALPDGSTTADAELIDIRIGANGKTYSSAGDAVRGQVEAIEDVLNAYNNYDIFSGRLNRNSATSSGGLTFTWSGDICTVGAGTSTGYSVNFLISSAVLPKYVIPGKTYYLKYSTTDTKVKLRFRFKDGDGSTFETYYRTTDYSLTIPLGTVKWDVSLFVDTGVVLSSDVTVSNIHLNNIALSLGEVEDALFSTLSKYAEAIPASSDLNDYNAAGNYIVDTAATAATITHGPVTNSSYRLNIIESTANDRLFQIALINSSANNVKLAIRNKTASGWNDWQLIPSMYTIDEVNNGSIKTTELTVTSSNYLTTFTNGSFNDAPINSIIYLGANVPLTDGPEGDSQYGNPAHPSSGYVRGTLMTYRSYAKSDTPRSGLTQILIGYRDTSYKPSISFRTSIYDNGMVWSDWSKFEENGYLHASNMVVYGGSLDLTFDDLDDMPNNSICQLDLNLDGHNSDYTLKHHPAPGVSCVAMCYAYSYTTDHGKVQTVFTIDGRMYWRYGYQQSAEVYNWTDWFNTSSNAMVNQGKLAEETNLNSVVKNSIYYLGLMPASGYVNDPITSGAGFLTVKRFGDIILQTVEALSGTRYTRYSDNAGSTWSDWV